MLEITEMASHNTFVSHNSEARAQYVLKYGVCSLICHMYVTHAVFHGILWCLRFFVILL